MATTSRTRNGTDDAKPVRAVEYVRMSTEHQQYSTQNQRAAIHAYADARGIEIVRTYEDAGRSGLRIVGRPALQRLLQDVQSGNADFQQVLVYDVSRWGRFQDADESAYYEYVCRHAGIRIVYCAEPFENDCSPIATIIKNVKRAMASEYSRELSVKVFAGQCRLTELGFRQGGAAGFGFRRMLIDQTGACKSILGPGEHKNLQSDRVVVVPGPREEVATVQQIYQWYVHEGLRKSVILRRLQAASMRTDTNKPWTFGALMQVLHSEKYIGHNVYNRTSCKLGTRRIRNPAEMWVRKDRAFDGIVDPDDFHAAQHVRLARKRQFTNDEMIEGLRRLFEERGYLTAHLIKESPGMATRTQYVSRFGSLRRAFRLAGFDAEMRHRYAFLSERGRYDLVPELLYEARRAIGARGGTVSFDAKSLLLRINGELTVSFVVARLHRDRCGTMRWQFRLGAPEAIDLTVGIRLDGYNRKIADYYLFPRLVVTQAELRFSERTSEQFEQYRFESLEPLYNMAERTSARSAA